MYSESFFSFLFFFHSAKLGSSMKFTLKSYPWTCLIYNEPVKQISYLLKPQKEHGIGFGE